MKRLFSFIFILIYFVVNTGFTLNLHYCMDEYYSWEIGESDEDCERCGMDIPKSDECCRDEVQVVKLQQDQLASGNLYYSFSSAQFITPTPSYILLPLQKVHLLTHSSVEVLSFYIEESTYIRNRVFRI